MTSSPRQHWSTTEEKSIPEKLEEYNHVEDLIMTYKKQFEEDCSEEEKAAAGEAAAELLERFTPFFKKYLKSIKNTKLNLNDKETRRFVLLFIGDEDLKRALRRDQQSDKVQREIRHRFNFVTETYGQLDSEDIMTDLQMLFLTLAKRYKQMGKNFCAYLYNAYSYEVSRHIMRFIKNPGNIAYKNSEFEDYMESYKDKAIEICFEDKIYEDSIGLPDMSWIAGTSCSEPFQRLTPFQRKLLVKYYMEDYNDRQIAAELDSHMNTINQKRRQAAEELAEALDIDPSEIQRSRKSGMKALFAHRN